LNVLTSTVEMGQGAKTVLAQIAADEMGLAVDRVHVSNPDTAFTPFDMLTSASRSTYCMGSAIRLAVRDIKGQLLEAAAERLEASKEDLVIQAGRIMVRGSPERSFSYSDVVRRTGYGTLIGRGTFVSTAGPGGGGLEFGLDFENGQGYGSAQWHPAVVACEVEVDLETGRVEVTRLHSELYAGKVINPKLCELQVQGAAIFGLGQALFEEIVLDTDGRTTNANLSDYMIPSFEDLPRQMTAHLLEPEGVTEVHGIGETNLPPVRPAIANAVCRAIGNRIFDLPITPEKVLAAVRKTNPRPGPGA
jgi:CO/xanthine dehydrogenase Mo-binding subunit